MVGAAIMIGPVAYAGGGELQFTVGEGRVTLILSGARLGDILAEWERTGNTRFVDVGDLDTVPVSLHLVGVPEAPRARGP